MKKVSLLALAPLTFLLASCGGPSGPDPLTAAFDASGTLQNFTPGQAYTITATAGTSTFNVGTINPDKTVTLKLPAEQVQANLRSISSLVESMKTAGCDASGLTYQDTGYRSFSTFDFTTASGTVSFITPLAQTKNPDGTSTQKGSTFWYAKTEGTINGQSTCPNDVLTYAISLKPGWNLVTSTSTFNPTTKKRIARYDNAASASQYNGPWYAYTTN